MTASVTAGRKPSRDDDQNFTFTQGNNRINGDAYDAVGNLMSDGLNGYLYDDENRISAVNPNSGGQLLYSYDAAGQRIRKMNGMRSTNMYSIPAAMRSPT